MAQHQNTEQPHASKQIAPYRTRECGPTAQIVSLPFARERDASLLKSTPASPLKTHPAARLSSVSPSRAATPFSSQRRISRADTAPRLNAAMSQSLDARQDLIGQCQSRRSWGDVQPAKLSRESAPKTHRGPVAADFGGVKGMEGARLQSARAPRFAPLAGRRPTEQRRFVRLLAGPLQSGAVVGGIQRPLPVPHVMRSAVRLLCSKDSSASGDTLVRNPSERDAAEQKPTPIKPGYWLNEFDSARPLFIKDAVYGPHPFRTTTPYLSAEIAEQRGLNIMAAANSVALEHYGLRYLGPVFFPEEGAA